MMVNEDQEGNSDIDIKALFDYRLIIPHSRISPLPNKPPPLKLILTNKPWGLIQSFTVKILFGPFL